MGPSYLIYSIQTLISEDQKQVIGNIIWLENDAQI